MDVLYVGTVLGGNLSCVTPVAVSTSSREVIELTEKWIAEKGDSTVRYRVQIFNISKDFADDYLVKDL
jgi:hypothetical protein